MMTTSAAQIRAYTGPALFSYGFRPFFLFGAAWSALAVALWLPMLSGYLALPTAFSPIEWHVHELLYGYVPAVIAGFLLTAVPNWTGRLPVVGTTLAALFATWIAGRLAVLTSGIIGSAGAALIDLLFLTTFFIVAAREVIAGRNWRNVKTLTGVAAMLIGNATFHGEALTSRPPEHGIRIGLAATLMLIMVIGGRIIPSFTRNWLARRGAGRLPAAFDKTDLIAIGVSVAALMTWIAWPYDLLTAALAIAAALINTWRLVRWVGERTRHEPLVLILHIGFGFVPTGFGLLALSILAPALVTSTGALHGWTAGAIGTMTLAVMTRASLGHAGRPLTASRAVQGIYLAVLVSASARIVAAFHLWQDLMLQLAAAAWVAAFVGFVIVYVPLLACRPK